MEIGLLKRSYKVIFNISFGKIEKQTFSKTTEPRK